MKTILSIMKKDFDRVFKDFKIVFMALIMPGLLIFIIYSYIGIMIKNAQDNQASIPLVIYCSNIPEEINTILNSDEIKIDAKYYEITNLNQHQNDLKDGLIDFIIIFPSTFSQDIIDENKPNIQYYYNPTSDSSLKAYNSFLAALNIYENDLLNTQFNYTGFFTTQEQTLFNEIKTLTMMISSLLPFLIIAFLIQGAMSLGPEAIAGEKERGTIANILITPTKRRDLALGKMFSLAGLASLSALSSFLGIIFSLPKLIGIGDISHIYGFLEYILILIVLLVSALVITGLVAILSTLAKNTKEASLIVASLYIITIIISMSSMFTSKTSSINLYYVVPIYNSLHIIKQIFTFEINYLQLLLTIISNIIFAIFFAFLLTKLFENENVMLAK